MKMGLILLWCLIEITGEEESVFPWSRKVGHFRIDILPEEEMEDGSSIGGKVRNICKLNEFTRTIADRRKPIQSKSRKRIPQKLRGPKIKLVSKALRKYDLRLKPLMKNEQPEMKQKSHKCRSVDIIPLDDLYFSDEPEMETEFIYINQDEQTEKSDTLSERDFDDFYVESDSTDVSEALKKLPGYRLVEAHISGRSRKKQPNTDYTANDDDDSEGFFEPDATFLKASTSEETFNSINHEEDSPDFIRNDNKIDQYYSYNSKLASSAPCKCETFNIKGKKSDMKEIKRVKQTFHKNYKLEKGKHVNQQTEITGYEAEKNKNLTGEVSKEKNVNTSKSQKQCCLHEILSKDYQGQSERENKNPTAHYIDNTNSTFSQDHFYEGRNRPFTNSINEFQRLDQIRQQLKSLVISDLTLENAAHKNIKETTTEALSTGKKVVEIMNNSDPAQIRESLLNDEEITIMNRDISHSEIPLSTQRHNSLIYCVDKILKDKKFKNLVPEYFPNSNESFWPKYGSSPNISSTLIQDLVHGDKSVKDIKDVIDDDYDDIVTSDFNEILYFSISPNMLSYTDSCQSKIHRKTLLGSSKYIGMVENYSLSTMERTSITNNAYSSVQLSPHTTLEPSKEINQENRSPKLPDSASTDIITAETDSSNITTLIQHISTDTRSSIADQKSVTPLCNIPHTKTTVMPDKSMTTSPTVTHVSTLNSAVFRTEKTQSSHGQSITRESTKLPTETSQVDRKCTCEIMKGQTINPMTDLNLPSEDISQPWPDRPPNVPYFFVPHPTLNPWQFENNATNLNGSLILYTVCMGPVGKSNVKTTKKSKNKGCTTASNHHGFIDIFRPKHPVTKTLGAEYPYGFSVHSQPWAFLPVHPVWQPYFPYQTRTTPAFKVNKKIKPDPAFQTRIYPYIWDLYPPIINIPAPSPPPTTAPLSPLEFGRLIINSKLLPDGLYMDNDLHKYLKDSRPIVKVFNSELRSQNVAFSANEFDSKTDAYKSLFPEKLPNLHRLNRNRYYSDHNSLRNDDNFCNLPNTKKRQLHEKLRALIRKIKKQERIARSRNTIKSLPESHERQSHLTYTRELRSKKEFQYNELLEHFLSLLRMVLKTLIEQSRECPRLYNHLDDEGRKLVKDLRSFMTCNEPP